MKYSLNKPDLQLLNYKQVGLFGGSFNPAHIGHFEMSKYALDKLSLDYVIWLVAPRNPFKPAYATSLELRAKHAAELVANESRIIVSGIEEEIQSATTYDTLLYFRRTYPNTEFTWLMGADCLERFNEWENYDQFTSLVNIALFQRKGYEAKRDLLKNGEFRVVFCDNQLVDISSTEIREGKK